MSYVRDTTETVEDLTFLAEHRVGATEAARRTGFNSPDTLDRWLLRHGHHHLAARLRRLEPASLHPQAHRQVAC